jgi:hypothetical protein
LRSLWGNPWKFESSRPHHPIPEDDLGGRCAADFVPARRRLGRSRHVSGHSKELSETGAIGSTLAADSIEIACLCGSW